MSDRCDPEIYKNGVEVFVTHTIRAADIEIWVQKIAQDSGQKVDWHYSSGRAQILALGDIAKVREAIISNRPTHDALMRQEIQSLKLGQLDEYIEGVWHYNGL
jgi:hypothetical protein